MEEEEEKDYLASSPILPGRKCFLPEYEDYKRYWSARLEKELKLDYQLLDFYCQYKDVQPILKDIIKDKETFLEIGSGISSFGRELIREFNMKKGAFLDVSKLSVDLQKSYLGKLGKDFDYIVGNVLELQSLRQKGLLSKTFDVIVEKGTLDVLFCSPSDDCMDRVIKTLRQIRYCLSKGGVFISFTNASPKEERIPYFEQINWNVESVKVPGNIGYMLTCTVD